MIPKRTSLWCSACAALVLADAAAACDTPVCVVDPDTLALTQIITFDDQPASFGPGIHLDTVLDLNGARFGERFSGQSLSTTGTHDNVTGAALGPPLVLIAGDAGQNLALDFPNATPRAKGRSPCNSIATNPLWPLICAAVKGASHRCNSCAGMAPASARCNWVPWARTGSDFPAATAHPTLQALC